MPSPRLREWLSRIAPVYPGEGRVVLLCLVVNFLIVTGIMFGRNARDALFLVYFGAEFLPYMYFSNAVFLVLCSVGYTALVDRVERGRLMAWLSVLFVAGLILSRLILLGHPHWFFPVLYIEAQSIWYFSLMQFWTFVGDLFDTRQAKRVFPLLAVGALLGMMGVGLESRAVVHSFGAENLLLVWAGMISAATLLGAVGFRRFRAGGQPPELGMNADQKEKEISEWGKIKEGVRDLGVDPLQRSLAGYVLLLWTVYAIVDFSFSKTMRARYPDPNDLATFFGRFVGAQGFLCLFIQLFFTRPLIARLGVGTTINFHPTSLLLGTLWMSLRYGYGSVLATKLGDATMLYTFSDSSYQLLYNPVPPVRRARVRGFIEGYIRPLSLAAAGGLILLGNRYLRPLHVAGQVVSVGEQLSCAAFALSAAWLGFALTAKKGYLRALFRNLQGDSPDLRQAAATALRKLKDPASLSLLSESLKSENPERVIAAVEFLESYGSEQGTQAIAGLLSHPNPFVRAVAASALSRRPGPETVEHLTPLLDDSDPRVRANAIEGIAATKDPRNIEKLRPLLRDSSIRARVNTVLAIAALQGVSAAAEWMPLMEKLMRGDRDARSAATYALARLPFDQSTDLLAELLKDPDIQIRCKAAQALGAVGSSRVIPELIETLAGPAELRHHVRRSIVAILQRSGDEMTQELMRTARESDRPQIRSELADVLGRLKDFPVLDTLIALLKDPEWRVRWKVLKSFERLARVGPLPEKARAALFEYARGELAAFRQSLLASRALVSRPGDEADRVLARALQEDRVKIEERVFHMLGILCGRDRMMTIFEKLNSGVPRLKADALEALDSLAPKGIAREVLDLLEPQPRIQTSRTPPGPLLASLTKYGKPWVRACAAYYLGHHPQLDGDGLLRTMLEDRDKMVRETALYAGWLAFKAGWRPQVEAALSSPDPALRRSAQRIMASNTHPESDPEKGWPKPMLTVEKVLFLKSAPLFTALDGEELAALADIALEKDYQPGDIIFEEGRLAHHLYVIVRGKVEVFHRVDSREYSIALLGEKECFGEMAILDDEPRSASVRAVEPTVILKIDRESFRELISERPQISFAIFKILSGRLRQKNLEVEKLHALDTARHYA